MAMAVACSSVSGGPVEGIVPGVCPAATGTPLNSMSIVIPAQCLRMGRYRLPTPVNQNIRGGHNEDGQENGSRETANNGARHRRILFRARAQLQRHRDHADDG